jgi:hypothetical protein
MARAGSKLESEIAEFERRYRAMPASVKIAYLRRSYLGECLIQRAMVKREHALNAKGTPVEKTIAYQKLKQAQQRLNELRVCRATRRKPPFE